MLFVIDSINFQDDEGNFLSNNSSMKDEIILEYAKCGKVFLIDTNLKFRSFLHQGILNSDNYWFFKDSILENLFILEMFEPESSKDRSTTGFMEKILECTRKMDDREKRYIIIRNMNDVLNDVYNRYRSASVQPSREEMEKITISLEFIAEKAFFLEETFRDVILFNNASTFRPGSFPLVEMKDYEEFHKLVYKEGTKDFYNKYIGWSMKRTSIDSFHGITMEWRK